MEKREEGLRKPSVMMVAGMVVAQHFGVKVISRWRWTWRMIAESKYRKVNIGPHAHPLTGEPLTGEPLTGDLTNKQGKKKKSSFIQFHSSNFFIHYSLHKTMALLL